MDPYLKQFLGAYISVKYYGEATLCCTTCEWEMIVNTGGKYPTAMSLVDTLESFLTHKTEEHL